MRSVRLTVAALAVGSVVAGCSQAEPEPDSASESASASGMHTMPDGTVMSDSEMHGEEPPASSEPSTSQEPSAAARMVCGGDVKDDLRRIVGMEDAPEASPSWRAPMFGCTYDLDSGPLVLRVHDAPSAEAGREHFDSLRRRLGDTRAIKGVYSLGLPAYETGEGTVVFIRDGKTLEVDATGLSGDLGPDGDMNAADVAYAMATSVLACWKHHA